ncbi:hypothetical protein H6775_01610 [Candidatus Nomurabacteria bacterium]|nr:hypothetical protein [Candidatus Nomurabacteria bacterium]
MRTVCVAFFKVEDEELLKDFEKIYLDYIAEVDERRKKLNSMSVKKIFSERPDKNSETQELYSSTINTIENKLKKILDRLHREKYFDYYQIDDVYPAYTLSNYLENGEYDIYPSSIIDFNAKFKHVRDFKREDEFEDFFTKKLLENKEKALVAIIQFKS